MDSGFQIGDSKFPICGTCITDSIASGIPDSWDWVHDSKSWIPDSKAENSGLNKQKTFQMPESELFYMARLAETKANQGVEEV